MKLRKFAALVTAAVVALCGCNFTADDEALDRLIEKADEIIGEFAVTETAETTAAAKTAAGTTAAAGETTAADGGTAVTDAEEAVDYSYKVTYTFRNDRYLREHFEKHGAEFGYVSEQEYVDGANSVIVSADALHKTEAEDGDDIYYIEATNEFVVVSTDGYIRTYFKPSRGINYYNSQ